jgi:hypothetical protein
MHKLLRKIVKWIAPKPQIGGTAIIPHSASTVQQAARELVERARQGDQIAIASISIVTKQAKQGNPKSKVAYQAIETYIKKNPVKVYTSFGYDVLRETLADERAVDLESAMGNDYTKAIIGVAPQVAIKSVPKAIVTIANGPSLLQQDSSTLIDELGKNFSDEKLRRAFALGVKHCDAAMAQIQKLPPECHSPLMIGYLIGMARRIQAIRLPNVPVSVLCRTAGWELGE